MDQLEFAQKLLEIVDMKLIYLDTIRTANHRSDQLSSMMNSPQGYNMMAYGELKRLDEQENKMNIEINQKISSLFSELTKGVSSHV